MLKVRMIVCAAMVTAVFLSLVTLPARADIYMKQKRHTDGFTIMGITQPAKDEIIVTWMGKDKSRTDTGDQKTTILRADKGLLYEIDHKQKTYKEMPLNIKQVIDENVAEKGEEVKEFAALAQDLAAAFVESMEVKVTETPEKRKIGSWNCRKYLMDSKMALGETTSEVWAAPELEIDWKSNLIMANAMMAGSPGFEKLIDKIYPEMSKIKGQIVLQIDKSKVMETELKSTTELLEFSKQTPPAGTYDVPAGYKKVK